MNDESKVASPNLALAPAQHLGQSIQGFSAPLAQFLQGLDLPIDNVLYSLEARKQIIDNLDGALSVLHRDERARSYYLTKFVVAVSVGLFDGALNYLWDETIGALRRRILRFDLPYFFSVVEKMGGRYKNLATEEHLNDVNDADLLDAARRIGLLSDVNFARLTHINYMRNHASAAHPNDQRIDSFEMLSWLRICLQHVIAAEFDQSVVVVKRLLDNLRQNVIPPVDFPQIGQGVERLSQEQVDDLLWASFGMYVDPRSAASVKDNVSGLAPFMWTASSENRRFEIGAKFGVYRQNGEVARKDAVQRFLELVGGQQYRDNDSLAGELIERLEALKRAHDGPGNFYAEAPHAQLLEQALPRTGVVPRAARGTWVKVITTCFVGNGYGYREGVDEGALPYYERYVERFSEAEVVEFLNLFGDVEFTSVLNREKPDRRVRALAQRLKDRHTNLYVQRALNLIVHAPPGSLPGLSKSGDFRRALEHLPAASTST